MNRTAMNITIPYQITTGQASDAEAIAQFQIDMALESEGTVLDRDTITCGVKAALEDPAKGLYLIARDQERPIGSLMLTREWSDWHNQWYWWIQSVYVAPDYRQKGVYRAMYTHIKAMARRSGIAQIRLYVDKTNTRAQQVYQQLGMEETHYLMYEEVL